MLLNDHAKQNPQLRVPDCERISTLQQMVGAIVLCPVKSSADCGCFLDVFSFFFSLTAPDGFFSRNKGVLLILKHAGLVKSRLRTFGLIFHMQALFCSLSTLILLQLLDLNRCECFGEKEQPKLKSGKCSRNRWADMQTRNT